MKEAILNDIIPTNQEILSASGMKIEPLDISADVAKEVIVSEKAKFKWRNELVEGKFKLSRLEFHLLAALSAHINKNTADFEWLCVSVNDLGDLLGIDNKNRFDVLEDVIERLHKRILAFESVERTSAGIPKRKVTTSWFTSIIYDYEHSYIVFKFAQDLKPLFLKVKEAYVEMPLGKLLPIKGIHSNRLFLLVTEWIEKDKSLKKKRKLKNKGPVITVVSIDDLKEQLGLESNYKKWKDFRNNVLDPSVEEIRTALGDNSYFGYEPIKTGRKYTHIRFIAKQIETYESEVVNKEEPIVLTEEQQLIVKELVGAGVVKQIAEKIVQDKPLENIRISIDYAKAQYAAGKVKKTLGAYMSAAIANGYGVAEARAAAQEAASVAAKAAKELEEQKQKLAQEADEKAAVQAKKDAIKAEFLGLEKAEQERYLDNVRQELAKEIPHKKWHYKPLIDNNIDNILGDENILDLLADYVKRQRDIELK